jgi:hypothetical protein
MKEQNDVVNIRQTCFYNDMIHDPNANFKWPKKNHVNDIDDDDDDCCTIITVPSEETDEVYDEVERKQEELVKEHLIHGTPVRKHVRFGSVKIHFHSLTATAASTVPVLDAKSKEEQFHDKGNHTNLIKCIGSDHDAAADDDDDIQTLDGHQKRLADHFRQTNMIGPLLTLEWKPTQTVRVSTVQEYDSIRVGHRRPTNMLRISKVTKDQIIENSRMMNNNKNTNTINNYTNHQQYNNHATTTTESINKIRREQQLEEKQIQREVVTVIIQKCKTKTQQESAIIFLNQHGFIRTATAVQHQKNRHQYDISISSNENTKSMKADSLTNSIEPTSVAPTSIPPTKLLTLNDLHAWDRSEFGVSSNISFALATAKKSKSSCNTTTAKIPLIFTIIEKNSTNSTYQNYHHQQQQEYHDNRQSVTRIQQHTTTCSTCSTGRNVKDKCNTKQSNTGTSGGDLEKKDSSNKSLFSKLKKKSMKIVTKHLLLSTTTVQDATLVPK